MKKFPLATSCAPGPSGECFGANLQSSVRGALLAACGCLFFAVGFETVAAVPGFAADAAVAKAAMDSITAEDAQNFVNVLADDSLEGRKQAPAADAQPALTWVSNSNT